MHVLKQLLTSLSVHFCRHAGNRFSMPGDRVQCSAVGGRRGKPAPGGWHAALQRDDFAPTLASDTLSADNLSSPKLISICSKPHQCQFHCPPLGDAMIRQGMSAVREQWKVPKQSALHSEGEVASGGQRRAPRNVRLISDIRRREGWSAVRLGARTRNRTSRARAIRPAVVYAAQSITASIKV